MIEMIILFIHVWCTYMYMYVYDWNIESTDNVYVYQPGNYISFFVQRSNIIIIFACPCTIS